MSISVETILQIIIENSTLVRRVTLILRTWIGSKAGAHKGAGWGVWHLSQSVYQKVQIKSDPSDTEKKPIVKMLSNRNLLTLDPLMSARLWTHCPLRRCHMTLEVPAASPHINFMHADSVRSENASLIFRWNEVRVSAAFLHRCLSFCTVCILVLVVS